MKAVHLVDEGVYLVSDAPYGARIECGGIPVPCGREFTTETLDDIVVVRDGPLKLDHWRAEDGCRMTEQEYTAQTKHLLTGAVVDDSTGAEFKFPNLDAEFAYRRFLEKWSPVYSPPEVVRQKAEVEVVEIRTSSGDPDITSLWNSPKAHVDRKLYQILRNQVARQALRATSAGLELDLPEHSGIRFAKLDGKYVFGDVADFGDRPFIGTLAQCQAEKARIVKLVTDVTTAARAAKEGRRLANAGEVLQQLRDIHSRAIRVRATGSSTGQLSSVRAGLANLINSLQAELAR